MSKLAGVCAVPIGKRQCAFLRSFGQQMARASPAHSSSRKKLSEGELVVVLLGYTKDALDRKADGTSGCAAASAGMTGPPMPRVIISHISDQSLSPWASWFQTCSTDAAFGAESSSFPQPFRVTLQADFANQYT